MQVGKGISTPGRACLAVLGWGGGAQGLGGRSLYVRAIITAFMGSVCCVFSLLAKQLPSWGIQLCPLAKGLSQLGLLTVFTSSWRAEEGHKTLT